MERKRDYDIGYERGMRESCEGEWMRWAVMRWGCEFRESEREEELGGFVLWVGFEED